MSGLELAGMVLNNKNVEYLLMMVNNEMTPSGPLVSGSFWPDTLPFHRAFG